MISTLSETLLAINITHYFDELNSVFDKEKDKFELKDTTKLLLSSPNYFQEVNNLLLDTSFETIKWHLIWRIVYFGAEYLDEDRWLLQKNIEGLVTGVNLTHEQFANKRWETCVTQVESLQSLALGHFFVQTHFSGESKAKLSILVDSVIEAFKRDAQTLDWIDAKTRESLLKKIGQLVKRLGYPDTPDIKNPVALMQYLNLTTETLSKDTMLENVQIIQQNTFQRQLRKLPFLTTEIPYEWDMPITVVNAFYSRTKNSINAPAGILRPPYYDAELPDYINYGSMGMFMGHELSHGFDNSGRKYDGEGKLKNWWTYNTAEKFDQKTKCFATQYEGFTMRGPDNQLYHIDPGLTMAEILADNSGLNQAESAWKALAKADNLLLPGIEKTPQQLFFQSFARCFCNVIRAEEAIRRIHTDGHPPMKYRINGALQNSPGFAEAYKCPAGSKMNPNNKCKLW